MKLKRVDKVQFCQNLSSSLLTPERCSQMYASYSGIPGDSDQVIDDDKLLDAYAEIFSENASMMDVINQLRFNPEYAKLSKGFVNVDATYDNLESFLIRDTGKDRYRNNINVKSASDFLHDLMKIRRLDPIKLKKGMDISPLIANPNAVCGTIASGKKKDHERVLLSYGLAIKDQVTKGISCEDVWIPAKGGHRAQLGGLVDSEDNTKLAPFADIRQKDRYVWAIDGGTGIFEAQYSMPLTEHLKRIDFFSPGKEPPQLRDLIRRARIDKNFWVSIDYSKFDQTIPRWLIEMCFDMVKEFYDVSYHREIGWIAHNFIYTHVIVPGGQVYVKDHGIPSGSGFTQIIGTLCNMMIILTYLASKCDGCKDDKVRYLANQLRVGQPNEERYGIFAQGDDNLFFTQVQIDMHDLSDYVHALFGVNINPEKCDQGSKMVFPTYLKREWRNFGEWQNPVYLVANTSHPESRRLYDCYSPWHIIYCLWLTYRFAFPENLSEETLIAKMRDNGGVDLLLRVPRNALPGIAKAFTKQYLDQVFTRASKIQQQMLVA